MRRHVPSLIFGLVLAAIYAPTFGRSFVSEDFLILRRLGREGFLSVAAESFGGPWLGVELVRFYRPLSSLLLQSELALFGAAPLPFALAHFAVHLLNTLLFARFLEKLDPAAPRYLPLLAAGLFAAYPLHPNTVVFIASFATLFATTAVLATLLAVQGPSPPCPPLPADGERGENPGTRAKPSGSLEEQGRRGLRGSFWAVAAGAAALLCYEQAVFVPIWLMLFLGLRGLGWRATGRAWLPHGVVLALFLAVRQAALGATLGGYPTFLRDLEPVTLLRGAATNLARLFWPDFSRPLPGWAPWLVVTMLGALAAWAFYRRRAQREASSLVLLGAAWLLLAPAPFVVVGVVPGNGRYFYLATLGLAMLLLGAGRLLARTRPALPATLLAAAVAGSLLVLAPIVDAHVEAGRVAERLRAELATLDPAAPVLVAGRPTFVACWGVPCAQVYHWGLADALLPPFTAAPAPAIWVLPELSDAELAPLLARPDLGRVLRCSGQALDPLPAPAGFVPTLEVTWRDDGSALFERRPGARYRLIAVAPGTASAAELGEGVALFDPEVIASMRVLYPGRPLHAWVDERAANGAWRASALHSLSFP